MLVTPPDNSVPVSPGQTSLTDQNQNQNQTLVCSQTEPPRGWMTAVHIRTEAERSCCREKYFRSNKHSPCSDQARCHMDPSARRCRLHQSIQAESDQSVRHRALKLVRLHKHRVSFSLSSERRPSSPAERLNGWTMCSHSSLKFSFCSTSLNFSL